MRKGKFDIHERTLSFSIRVAKFVYKLPKFIPINEYGKQLVRSSGSVGANLIEADGALSKKDFLNKMGISRREAKESNYWLKLIKGADLLRSPENKSELEYLQNESRELKNILSSIIDNTRRNKTIGNC